MEYSRRINISNGQVAADKTNVVNARILDYGSVFLPSQAGSSGNLLGANVAELLLSRGFADITHHYDSLLAAYSQYVVGLFTDETNSLFRMSIIL